MMALRLVSLSIVRNAVICWFLIKWLIQGFHSSKLMGSGTHSSIIDGFLETHGTDANGANGIYNIMHASLIYPKGLSMRQT